VNTRVVSISATSWTISLVLMVRSGQNDLHHNSEQDYRFPGAHKRDGRHMNHGPYAPRRGHSLGTERRLTERQGPAAIRGQDHKSWTDSFVHTLGS